MWNKEFLQLRSICFPFSVFKYENVKSPTYMTVTRGGLDLLPLLLRVGEVDVDHWDTNLQNIFIFESKFFLA